METKTQPPFTTKLDPDTVRVVETALTELAHMLEDESINPNISILQRLRALGESHTCALLASGGLRGVLRKIDPSLP